MKVQFAILRKFTILMPWNWRERMAHDDERGMRSLEHFDTPAQFFESHKQLRVSFTKKCQELADMKARQ